VAVRIPMHAMALELLQNLSFPLAAPSANPFSYVSPTSAQHVYDQLNSKIPYILDGGTSKIGMESTIISFSKEIPRIIRLGGISVEQILEILPDAQVDVQFNPHENAESAGQSIRHYAPKCILEPLERIALDGEIARTVLLYSKQSEVPKNARVFYLSESGSEIEATQNLFAMVRKFDEMGLDQVYFEWAPNKGLGRAINDRLSRAMKK